MSRKTETVRVREVKLALAAKYEGLAKVAHSQPKRKRFANLAARYRRQAEDLSRQ